MLCQKSFLNIFQNSQEKTWAGVSYSKVASLRLEHLHESACLFFKYIHAIFTVYTAWKVSKCRGFSSPYFPLSELNTEIYGVNLFISVQIQEKTDQKKLRIFFAQCYLNFCFYFNFEFLKNFHTALFYKINKFFSRNIYKSIFLGGTAQQKLCYMET